jgi:hypothetical protein
VDVVTFAFGDRPQIDDLDARNLIDSLGARRSHGATRVVGKIDGELQKAPEERRNIRLTASLLDALVTVLSADMPSDRPELAHLYEEARGAYSRGEWVEDE